MYVTRLNILEGEDRKKSGLNYFFRIFLFSGSENKRIEKYLIKFFDGKHSWLISVEIEFSIANHQYQRVVTHEERNKADGISNIGRKTRIAQELLSTRRKKCQMMTENTR